MEGEFAGVKWEEGECYYSRVGMGHGEEDAGEEDGDDDDGGEEIRR